MKKRILFWCHADFTYYFTAYYMSKKYESEFYAIVDTAKKPSDFYKNQNHIKFSQMWFLQEEITKNNKNLDLDYLEKIEQEYELNIWKLALNERYFHNFFNFHKFSKNEILTIEQNCCKLFEKIIKEYKPDLVITREPGLHHLKLFIQMCEKKNIQVIQLKIPIGKKLLIAKSDTAFDKIPPQNSTSNKNLTFDDFQQFYHENRLSLSIDKSVLDVKPNFIDKMKTLFEYLLSKQDLKNDYTYFGKTKIKTLKFIFGLTIRKKIRENFMNQNLSQKLPDSDYIYYAMNVDMDANQLIRNPIYNNQIEMIRIIAKSIPSNFVLVVKEHPAQIVRDWRSIKEMKEILEIPNVIYLHPTFSQHVIYQKSNLVITSSGSAGLECQFFGKPSIIFSDTIFSYIPSVFKVTDLNNLHNKIIHALKTKVNPLDIENFLDTLTFNSVDFDLLEFGKMFQSEFMHNGLIINTEINSKKMQDALSKYEKLFEPLTNALISKINEE